MSKSFDALHIDFYVSRMFTYAMMVLLTRNYPSHSNDVTAPCRLALVAHMGTIEYTEKLDQSKIAGSHMWT